MVKQSTVQMGNWRHKKNKMISTSATLTRYWILFCTELTSTQLGRQLLLSQIYFSLNKSPFKPDSPLNQTHRVWQDFTQSSQSRNRVKVTSDL